MIMNVSIRRGVVRGLQEPEDDLGLVDADVGGRTEDRVTTTAAIRLGDRRSARRMRDGQRLR
jgi:hypothetical protein